MIRSGHTFTVYFDGVSDITATDTNFNAIDYAGSLYFGDRGDNARNMNGSLAEVAKWDRALSADEIKALSKGYSPRCFLNGLKWYMPMIRDFNEIKTGIAVTNNGGSTAADHPRIIYCGQGV